MKRTETLRSIVPESLYEYARWESRRQGRTVSTYLMRLVERDMRANDEFLGKASPERESSAVDMLSSLSNGRPRFEARKAAFPLPTKRSVAA